MSLPVVDDILKQNEILCLRVERMPVNHDQFSDLKNVPYLAVITPATHDMSPLREWWQEGNSPIQWYYNYSLKKEGIAPVTAEGNICREIIYHHLSCPAMWSVFLIQDLLAMDNALRLDNPMKERINDPADPGHQWKYRIHLSVETLLSAKTYNHSLKAMIRLAGR